MHPGARRAVQRFYAENRAHLDAVRVADMGALNINGATRDVIPHTTGFDIVEGPGVDVCLTPGHIPPAHRGQYGAVTCISSFTFCPQPALYKRQLVDVLAPGGLMLLTACSPRCRQVHSTSNNPLGFQDSFRLEPRALADFFADAFDILEAGEWAYDHPDCVLVARLKATAGPAALSQSVAASSNPTPALPVNP